MRPLFFGRWVSFVALVGLLCSCDRATEGDWTERDLTQYNVPITIKAPDSIAVKTLDLGGPIDDITVTSPDEPFELQILASRAQTNDLAKLKAEQIELVRDNRYFDSILEEDDKGFLFENKIDSLSFFGFRHVVYQGDREYILQNTFGSTRDLAETRAIYEAVKQ